MTKIQVWKSDGSRQLGKGDGSLDPKAGTAQIDSWTDKPGLMVGSTYQLKSSGKTYRDVRCDAIGLPAQFSGFA